MNNETLKLLNKLRKEKNPDFFLIVKMCMDPSFALATYEEEIINGIYYDKNVISNYILNNNFLEFLCISDLNEIFNNSNLIALHFFLTKVEEIYEIIKENNFNKRKSIKFLKKYMNDVNVDLIDNMLEKAKVYDISSSSLARCKILNTLNKIFQKNALSNLMKKDINDEDFILNKMIEMPDIIYSIACSNEFLDIIDKKLLKENLSETQVNEIIKVLDFSFMAIVTNDEKVSNENKKSYDMIWANSLRLKLEEKRQKNIIYFPRKY